MHQSYDSFESLTRLRCAFTDTSLTHLHFVDNLVKVHCQGSHTHVANGVKRRWSMDAGDLVTNQVAGGP